MGRGERWSGWLDIGVGRVSRSQHGGLSARAVGRDLDGKQARAFPASALEYRPGTLMDKRRIRATVRGLVQGVSYRAATVDEARRLGLTGWVANRRDGAVELEAQGPVDAVERLVAWCHHGPPLADVSAVEVADVAAVEGEVSFTIRH
jgi:acylphosphatase